MTQNQERTLEAMLRVDNAMRILSCIKDAVELTLGENCPLYEQLDNAIDEIIDITDLTYSMYGNHKHSLPDREDKEYFAKWING